MPDGEKEIEVTVYGKVQGVNYRGFVKTHADKIGVTGWVKNEDDGTVSVVAQGSVGELASLVELLHKGPYFARVDEVDVQWSDTPQDAFTDFHIDY